MLAYVFWHRPAVGVARERYESALREFHERLAHPSASFRLDQLPFDTSSGYEDWYLTDDWHGLGELAAAAVDAERGPAHDGAARLAGDGWGAVYELVHGDAVPPAGCRWATKPRGDPAERFLRSLDGSAVWRRQLVLGPAPEFCVATMAVAGRVPVVQAG